MDDQTWVAVSGGAASWMFFCSSCSEDDEAQNRVTLAGGGGVSAGVFFRSVVEIKIRKRCNISS